MIGTDLSWGSGLIIPETQYNILFLIFKLYDFEPIFYCLFKISHLCSENVLFALIRNINEDAPSDS